jgi:hypothetical protein
MFWTSSVLIKPGCMRVFQILFGKDVVIKSEDFFSGTGRVNL